MATKTITVDLEAYERLRRARLEPRESFSRVIKRARWDELATSGAAWVAAFDDLPVPPAGVVERLEEDQRLDVAPLDSWQR